MKSYVSIPYRQARYAQKMALQIYKISSFNSLQVGQVPRQRNYLYSTENCFNSLQVGQVLGLVLPFILQHLVSIPYRQARYFYGELDVQVLEHSFNSLQVGQVLIFSIIQSLLIFQFQFLIGRLGTNSWGYSITNILCFNSLQVGQVQSQLKLGQYRAYMFQFLIGRLGTFMVNWMSRYLSIVSIPYRQARYQQ